MKEFSVFLKEFSGQEINESTLNGKATVVVKNDNTVHEVEGLLVLKTGGSGTNVSMKYSLDRMGRLVVNYEFTKGYMEDKRSLKAFMNEMNKNIEANDRLENALYSFKSERQLEKALRDVGFKQIDIMIEAKK